MPNNRNPLSGALGTLQGAKRKEFQEAQIQSLFPRQRKPPTFPLDAWSQIQFSDGPFALPCSTLPRVRLVSGFLREARTRRKGLMLLAAWPLDLLYSQAPPACPQPASAFVHLCRKLRLIVSSGAVEIDMAGGLSCCSLKFLGRNSTGHLLLASGALTVAFKV